MHQGSFTEKSALEKIRQIVCVVPQHPYNNPTGAKSLDTAPYVYRSMVLRWTGREGEGGRIRVGKAQVGKEWERTGRNLGPECDRRIEMPRFVERVSSYNSVISTHAFCVLILKPLFHERPSECVSI